MTTVMGFDEDIPAVAADKFDPTTGPALGVRTTSAFRMMDCTIELSALGFCKFVGKATVSTSGERWKPG